MPLHYSMVIQWSDEDRIYTVSFPEWEDHGLIGHAHGASYEEAARNGREVLLMLHETALRDGDQLPEPRAFDGTITKAPRVTGFARHEGQRVR